MVATAMFGATGARRRLFQPAQSPRPRIAGAVAYIITQPCIGVKDASCVEVCPVDCIHTDDDAEMYFIDPDECIDCGACVDPCPVDAIFPEDETPAEWTNFIQINADYFKR
jgi:ferredoxin